MKEWLQEALANYEFHIPSVNGSGKYWLWFVLSVILILIWRNKDRMHRAFAGYIGLLTVTILFPFFVPLFNKIMNGDYWRCFWFLTMPVVVAFTVTKLVTLPKNRIITWALTGMILVGLWFSGIFQYNEANFTVPQNLYKVPQDVVEICDIIHGQVEDPKLASPGEVNFRVRQYDATIVSESSRYGLGSDKLAALMNPEGEYDLQAIRERALKRECNCIALRNDRLPENGDFTGYTLLGITGPAQYHVYELDE